MLDPASNSSSSLGYVPGKSQLTDRRFIRIPSIRVFICKSLRQVARLPHPTPPKHARRALGYASSVQLLRSLALSIFVTARTAIIGLDLAAMACQWLVIGKPPDPLWLRGLQGSDESETRNEQQLETIFGSLLRSPRSTLATRYAEKSLSRYRLIGRPFARLF